MKKYIEKVKRRAKSLKTEIRAVYLAYTKHKLPWYAKLLAALVIAYALSPIDIIPDFIPVLGLLDDVILLPLGIALLIKIIPSDVMEECRRQAQNASKEKLPKNYLVAVLIILLWIVILALIIYKIIRAASG